MGCQGSKAAKVSKPEALQSIGSTLLEPACVSKTGETFSAGSGVGSESGQLVGFTDVVEVPLVKGSTPKVVDWLLNDANGLKYTCAQKGNISATGNVYTTEEGVEMIAFFGEWETKEDFDAYFASEGRTNESWKEFCAHFAGPPKITAMLSMSRKSVLNSDVNRASKHLVGFTDLVEVPLGKGNTSQAVDWLLNDPNGLKYTCAQPGNISATGNVYTTAEGVETVVFFGEWASKADFDAYLGSEGRTNDSWKEFCKNFAGAPKVTAMTPMKKLGKPGHSVGFTDVVEVPLLKGSTAKVVDWLLNDANGLKYTCAQKGNVSATGNVYTTEEGVEMIAFFGEWETKDDFDAYFASEGRTNDSWNNLCMSFAGPPTVTAMTSMSGQSVLNSDANRASKHLVGFTNLVEVPLVKGGTGKVVDWLLNDPNGLIYTCAQPGNISATGNVYTTAEGDTVVFFGEWTSKANFEAYFTSEGRTNNSWKEFCENFAGAPKITAMLPMDKYSKKAACIDAEADVCGVVASSSPSVDRSSAFTCFQDCRSAGAHSEIIVERD